MTTYSTLNGAKPRYDGKGTEFGLMHRDLGPGFLMFDIDRLSAVIEVNLELKRENEGFVEYRHTCDGINFVAMFEVKAHKTKYSLEALDLSKSNSLARAEIARRLECRLFVVFGTNGKQPFEFFELFDNGFILAGTLEYDESNRMEQVKKFWNETLRIEK